MGETTPTAARAEPAVQPEASGGLQIESAATEAIENPHRGTNTTSNPSEPNSDVQDNPAVINPESFSSADPISRPKSDSPNNLPNTEGDQTSNAGDSDFGGGNEPAPTPVTNETTSISPFPVMPSQTANTCNAVDIGQAFPGVNRVLSLPRTGPIDSSTLEMQTSGYLQAGAVVTSGMEAMTREKDIARNTVGTSIEEPPQNIIPQHTSLEDHPSPAFIINGIPSSEVDSVDRAIGSSREPSSDGFHDSTHHTPRRSGSFKKEDVTSQDHVLNPSPLHISSSIVPDPYPL